MKTAFKNFYGVILGWVESKPNGDIYYYDYPGKLLGYYCKSQDCTKDFYGRTICKGNMNLIPTR